jgi:hypothetical protein
MANFNFVEGDKFLYCSQGIGGLSGNGMTGTIASITRNYCGRIDRVHVKWDSAPEHNYWGKDFAFVQATRDFKPMSLCHRCTHRLERVTSPRRCSGKTFTPLPGVWQNYWQERLDNNPKIAKKEDEFSQDLF